MGGLQNLDAGLHPKEDVRPPSQEVAVSDWDDEEVEEDLVCLSNKERDASIRSSTQTDNCLIDVFAVVRGAHVRSPRVDPSQLLGPPGRKQLSPREVGAREALSTCRTESPAWVHPPGLDMCTLTMVQAFSPAGYSP